MERERQIAKLVNVLYRIARNANQEALEEAEPDSARFCAAQYNRLLERLTELEPAVAHAFAPLMEDAPLTVTRMAALELAAYFEADGEDAPVGGRSRRHRGGVRVRVGWSPKIGCLKVRRVTWRENRRSRS